MESRKQYEARVHNTSISGYLTRIQSRELEDFPPSPVPRGIHLPFKFDSYIMACYAPSKSWDNNTCKSWLYRVMMKVWDGNVKNAQEALGRANKYAGNGYTIYNHDGKFWTILLGDPYFGLAISHRLTVLEDERKKQELKDRMAALAESHRLAVLEIQREKKKQENRWAAEAPKLQEMYRKKEADEERRGRFIET